MGWGSKLLLLLFLRGAPPCSSGSSTKLIKKSENKIIFDCTQLLNELLLNNVAPASISLLKTALNGSWSTNTIYYKWDESVEHFFPHTFLRITDILESSGWGLGVAGSGGGERRILLSTSVSKSFQYFERLTHKASVKNQTLDELLGRKLEKMKLYLQDHRLRIIMSHSLPSENSCDIISSHPTGVAYADAMRRLLGPHLGTAYEYDENVKCEYHHLPPSSSTNVVLVLLSIELVSAERFPESYGLFSDLVSQQAKIKERIGVEEIGYTTGPIRLHLKPSTTGTSSSQDKDIETGYAALLARFAVRWASETGKAVIIEATKSIISNLRGPVEDIVPTIEDNVIPRHDTFDGCSNDNPIMSSELALLIAKRFKLMYIHLSDTNISDCGQGSKSHRCDDGASEFNCNSTFQQLPGKNSSLKLLLDIDLDKGEPALEQAVRLFKQHKNNNNKSDDITIQAILFRNSHFSSGEFAQAVADFEGISDQFGCSVGYKANLTIDIMLGNASAFANKLSNYCNLPSTNLVIYDIERIWNPDLALMDYFRYTSSVQPRLSVFSSGVRLLKSKFPNVSVILKLPEAGTRLENDWKGYYSLFCSAQLENANKIVEAFVTWSYIHKIPVVLKNIISTDSRIGWWDRLGAAAGGGTRAFATRNHPKTMEHYLEGGGEPCLERLEDPPQSTIPMVAGGMGCTFHVPQLVGPPELGLMLEFALHKFSNVEIIIGGNLDQVMSQLEHSLSTSAEPSHIFLQVPLETSGLEMQTLLLKLSNLVEELKSKEPEARISLQISNRVEADSSSALLSRDLETFLQHAASAGVPIGLVIGNCTGRFLEEGVLQDQQFLYFFSFLICAATWDINYNIGQADKKPNYFATMTDLLDQLYAIKTAFHRKFPDKEIYFRPEFSTWSSSDYLRTLRDVNQHAELYHMKYFAVNAFDYPSPDRGSSWQRGWWRVEDMANLSNPSNYFERESERLSLIQWRPPLKESGKGESTFSWQVFVPSGVGFIIMVILALVLFAIWKRSESRYLTRIEELEYLNGGSNDVDGPDAASILNQCLNMKFDKNYEIPKTNLKSEEATIIGGGNFGLVYRALVKGVLVAVKIPKIGCSPDLFKATLQEIKIMCYVGCHENVVRFVGAYIKEIRRGIVQVATELCVNGTLLSHLRGLGRSIVGTDLEGSESLSELVAAFDLERFCMEIAAGMDFLGSKWVIHGDLAARNVLLYQHFTCKIGDFGLSRNLYEYETYVKEGQRQEPLPWRWMAVETLDKREFSVKSDVWSYGVTLWEIYSLGSVPYPGLNWTPEFVENLSSGGLRLQKPKYSTDELYGKLLACWNVEAGARPTFSELCHYFRTIRHGQYAPVLGNIQESTF